MKYTFTILFVVVVHIDLAHSISFGTFVGWLKNALDVNTSNGATATNCKTLKNRRKCRLDTKTLNLDSNKEVEIIVTANGRKIKCRKTFNGSKTHWSGNCDGDADDANFIARFDKNGKKSIHGSIHVGNEICQIGPNILGDEEILCIPKNEFQTEDDPRSIPPEESPNNLRMLPSDTKFGFIPVVVNNAMNSSLRGSNHHNDGRQLFDNSGGNIDVLVVWTKLAECRKAGLVPGCVVTASTENVMRGLIDLAIAETNTAYALSGIFTSLRLVHAYRDPDYVEGEDFYTSLEHITTPNDGFMDSVHSKRVLYGADAVQMIGGATSSCGIAWSGEPSINYMFSVTRYSCATGYYTFGHEIGHNVGMFHDRGTENSCSEPATFNYGYRDPNADFRTILSYDCKMGECDSMPKDGCSRVQRFSNSDSRYTYNGKPIGDAKRDNAKQMNNVRAIVAAYFPAMNCQADTECNDNNSNTVDTCNTANKVCVFTPGVPINAPIRPPTTAPSTRVPTRTVTRSPTNVPTRAPVQTIAPSLQPLLSAPIKIPIPAPTLSTVLPTQPVRSPVPTNIPTWNTPTKVPVPTQISTSVQPTQPVLPPVPTNVPTLDAPTNVPVPTQISTSVQPTQPVRAPVPTKFPTLDAPTKVPTQISTSVPPTQPVRAPVPTNVPTLGPLISSARPAGSPAITQPTVNAVPIFLVPSRRPTRAPTTIVDEPIVVQEQKGFFSMIFQLFGDFLTRLFGSGR